MDDFHNFLLSVSSGAVTACIAYYAGVLRERRSDKKRLKGYRRFVAEGLQRRFHSLVVNCINLVSIAKNNGVYDSDKGKSIIDSLNDIEEFASRSMSNYSEEMQDSLGELIQSAIDCAGISNSIKLILEGDQAALYIHEPETVTKSV